MPAGVSAPAENVLAPPLSSTGHARTPARTSPQSSARKMTGPPRCARPDWRHRELFVRSAPANHVRNVRSVRARARPLSYSLTSRAPSRDTFCSPDLLGAAPPVLLPLALHSQSLARAAGYLLMRASPPSPNLRRPPDSLPHAHSQLFPVPCKVSRPIGLQHRSAGRGTDRALRTPQSKAAQQRPRRRPA